MMTFTRCSSTPSAEIFVKPDGSTRRTRPSSAWPPPHCSMRTRAFGRNPDGVGRQQVGDHLQLSRVADFDERFARLDDRFALSYSLQHDAVDRGDDLDRRGRPPPAAGGVRGRSAGRTPRG